MFDSHSSALETAKALKAYINEHGPLIEIVYDEEKNVVLQNEYQVMFFSAPTSVEHYQGAIEAIEQQKQVFLSLKKQAEQESIKITTP